MKLQNFGRRGTGNRISDHVDRMAQVVKPGINRRNTEANLAEGLGTAQEKAIWKHQNNNKQKEHNSK
jgi:hypothetical protein